MKPRLVTDLSHKQIDISYSFAGANLLLYGAIINPPKAIAGRDYDIAVVVRGPDIPSVVRKKERVVGIWANTKSASLASVPSFYAVVSTKPIAKILDDKVADIYELGLNNLHFSPTDFHQKEDLIKDMVSGLIDRKRRQRLYYEADNAIRVTENILFRTQIHMPSSTPTGDYETSVFLIQNKRVVGQSTVIINVDKVGFERRLFLFAHEKPLAYGLSSLLLTLGLGLGLTAAMKRLFRN